MEKSDVIIDRDVAIPDAHVLRQAILGEDNRTVESLGTRKGPKAREFLTEAHATEFFSARVRFFFFLLLSLLVRPLRLLYRVRRMRTAKRRCEGLIFLGRVRVCSIALISTKHRKIRYAIPRQLDGFPAWTTTFMGFKPAGVRTVYDITVPTMNNFLAAGITVHNCGGFNSAAVVLVADHKVNVIVHIHSTRL